MIAYISSPGIISASFELSNIELLTSLTTVVVCGSGVLRKIIEKIKIESKKLARGPANIINALCYFGFESKVFCICSLVS